MNQAKLKVEYERQQSHEGQKALQIKCEFARRFSKVIGKPVEIQTIQTMRNECTGEDRYYYATKKI